jgi:hypothetical protein
MKHPKQPLKINKKQKILENTICMSRFSADVDGLF